MRLLVPISKAIKILAEAKSNGITYNKVRPNVYDFECATNPIKIDILRTTNVLFKAD